MVTQTETVEGLQQVQDEEYARYKRLRRLQRAENVVLDADLDEGLAIDGRLGNEHVPEEIAFARALFQRIHNAVDQ